tara:strand:- start:24183 stop:24557 length:375 start_codon:yes stop_codon:yes gene_type:complete
MKLALSLAAILVTSTTLAHQPRSVAPTDASGEDSYSCPTRSSDSPCKIVCSAPGMEVPFVKSNVDSLTLTFFENSFNVKGRTFEKQFATADQAISFSGYFDNSVSCMIFGLELEQPTQFPSVAN